MQIDAWAVVLLVVAALMSGVVIRGRGLKESLTLFRESNSELRSEIQYKDLTIEKQHRECQHEITELRASYERRMGEMSGRIETLQSTFLDGLGKQVVTAVAEGVAQGMKAFTDG